MRLDGNNNAQVPFFNYRLCKFKVAFKKLEMLPASVINFIIAWELLLFYHREPSNDMFK